MNIDEVEVEKCRVEEEGQMQVDELEGQLSLAQEEVERTVSSVDEIGNELTTYKRKVAGLKSRLSSVPTTPKALVTLLQKFTN